ncbi:protein kinase [Candidatus Woesebacteria bacterium]|nr:protein kinase [Candidatus Woesebacteria bacterium]
MIKTENQELIRKLMPLEETYWSLEKTYGIPSDSASRVENISIESSINNLMYPGRKPVSLRNVYQPQKVLNGKEAENSRFIFSLGTQLNQGGTATIHRAFDRLLGKAGIAKVIHQDSSAEFRHKVNEQVQLEAEIMSILTNDPYLKSHIVEVWDVSNVRINGKDSIVIFEEYMDTEKYFTLNRTENYRRLAGPQRLSLIEQLCKIVDKLAEYQIFHHDLSAANIFVDLETLQVKIGDFGTSNFAFNVGKYGVEVNAAWTSPERELYDGKTEDPGLASEVFSLTTLAYFIITGGDRPFVVRKLPSERYPYLSTSKKFETGFHPDSGNDLRDLAKNIFNKEQIERLIIVFEKGLALDPAERYQCGEELMNAINEAILPPDEIIGFVRE